MVGNHHVSAMTFTEEGEQLRGLFLVLAEGFIHTVPGFIHQKNRKDLEL